MRIVMELFKEDDGDESIKKEVRFFSYEGPISVEFMKREVDVVSTLVGAEALSQGWIE